jgi:hypothetical protein
VSTDSAGVPHLLLVSDFIPEDPVDCFEVKHFDDCPHEIGDFIGEFKSYNCAVGEAVYQDGVSTWFRHRDEKVSHEDSREVLAPGKYLIEVWSQVDYWGEWDGGLRLASVG